MNKANFTPNQHADTSKTLNQQLPRAPVARAITNAIVISAQLDAAVRAKNPVLILRRVGELQKALDELGDAYVSMFQPFLQREVAE